MNVALAWIISTVALGVLVGLVDYVDGSTRSLIQRVSVWSVVVLVINTIIWLPLLSYLRKKSRLTAKSSVASSLVAGFSGMALLLGFVGLVLYQDVSATGAALVNMPNVSSTSSISFELSGFIEGMTKITVCWGLNGLLFWLLVRSHATNKCLNVVR